MDWAPALLNQKKKKLSGKRFFSAFQWKWGYPFDLFHCPFSILPTGVLDDSPTRKFPWPNWSDEGQPLGCGCINRLMAGLGQGNGYSKTSVLSFTHATMESEHFLTFSLPMPKAISLRPSIGWPAKGIRNAWRLETFLQRGRWSFHSLVGLSLNTRPQRLSGNATAVVLYILYTRLFQHCFLWLLKVDFLIITKTLLLRFLLRSSESPFQYSLKYDSFLRWSKSSILKCVGWFHWVVTLNKTPTRSGESRDYWWVATPGWRLLKNNS